MANWMKQINSAVKKQIDEYERGKYTLSEEEIEEVMPKVVDFYNNHPEDQDVYRDANGIILLIQTPKQIVDKNGKTLNKLEPYDSYTGDKTYLLRNCKFRFHGKTETLSIFASKEQWKEMNEVYDKKAFIKASKLTPRYSRIGTDDKPMKLDAFCKKHELEDIDEMDESEYLTFYSVNVAQVIT